MNKAFLSEDINETLRHFGRPDFFAGQTVVLTGAGGFLGYFLTHAFCAMAAHGGRLKKLVLADNFMLGRPSWLTALQKDHPYIDAHTLDLTQENVRVSSFLEGADYVMHMASIASPVFYRRYPLETMDANVWLLRKMLEYHSQHPLKAFLLFSSSEIYGDPCDDSIPTPESYAGRVSCLGPRACYDESKRFAETLAEVFYRTKGVPVRIVRPFNNYGPGMRLIDGRVPADFACAVLDHKDIVIYSDGSPTRTFCYVSDAAAGYLKALAYDRFDCFNIGMDAPEISIRQLAEIYCEHGADMLGYKGRIIFEDHKDKDYLKDNPNRRCPDISKARQVLHFDPRVKVREGVGRFLRFLDQERAI